MDKNNKDKIIEIFEFFSRTYASNKQTVHICSAVIDINWLSEVVSKGQVCLTRFGVPPEKTERFSCA